MNLFDQVRRNSSPLKHYEREFMCSVEGVLLPNEAFDYDLGQRDFMCRECRAREVEDDRQEQEDNAT